MKREPKVGVIAVALSVVGLAVACSRAPAHPVRRLLDGLVAAASDAHTPGELGSTYTEVPDFDGPEAFLESLKQAKLVTKPASPVVHVLSYWARLRRRAFRWKPV